MGGWGFAHWLMFAIFVEVVAYPLGLVLKHVRLWVVTLSGGKEANSQI